MADSNNHRQSNNALGWPIRGWESGNMQFAVKRPSRLPRLTFQVNPTLA